MHAADGLIEFVDASPTPFHACEAVAARLIEAGFGRMEASDPWPTVPGRYFLVNAGSLVAWNEPEGIEPAAPFRVLGAHTDSPNLRLKQHHDKPDRDAAMIALEPYGGVLLESWLDRDLGVAGRVFLSDGSSRLVRIDEPWLRVPRLAIHLDRDRSAPDRQRHLDAIWSTSPAPFMTAVGDHAGFDADEVTGFDLMSFDLQPSARTGGRGEFVSAPRLDNLATCWSALQALLTSNTGQRSVMVLFDHEEVGSGSERGAQSPMLDAVLERLVLAAGGGREELYRALAASVLVSGDMAHATHPNHRERHEPLHQIRLGGGPVLKINHNLRYATDARGAAFFADACARAGVPLQRYVHRADLPCGSTIGPISAARTGILTIDVGAPQLAMHSAREMMAASDVDHYSRALTAVLDPDLRS